MYNRLITYLQSLNPLPSEDVSIITDYFTLKSFKEGDYLIEANKIAREMFFVCNGVIRIGSVNEKGTELTHVFYNEDHFVSIIQSFNDEVSSPAFMQACCDVEVLCINKSKLFDLYQKLPYLKDLITNINQTHLIEKVNTRNAYLGMDAESRYRLFIGQHPDIVLRVALKDIASYLGITPQSLSRIRKNI